ncbi:MAG: pyridoxal phosphate-dependent aminotransferase family protein [Alphaproteobacteria bacterium]|nr:pyridoxal phosphate-dependent aminotransferase family protein [Rickettsiales bacterium]
MTSSIKEKKERVKQTVSNYIKRILCLLLGKKQPTITTADKANFLLQDGIFLDLNAQIDKYPFRSLFCLDRIKGKYFTIKNDKKIKLFNFSSNDYLNLSRCPKIYKFANSTAKKYGTGSGGSRLIGGNMSYYSEVENDFADFFGYESSLLFGSGTLCNMGVISSIATPDDVCVIDKLSHSSIINGVNLSGAKMLRFLHSDVASLEEKLKQAIDLLGITLSKKSKKSNIKYKKNTHDSNDSGNNGKIFVITESIFSIGGDIAPLEAILKICNKYNAFFVVDESHSIGVSGENGRGVCDQLQIKPYIITASLGKAFASSGGICFCSSYIKTALINLSKQFIFTTAPSPHSVAVAHGVLNRIKKNNPICEYTQKWQFFSNRVIKDLLEEIDYGAGLTVKTVHHNCNKNISLIDQKYDANNSQLSQPVQILPWGLSVFKNSNTSGADKCAICTINPVLSQIMPILLKSEELALKIADDLINNNIYVKAIRYPAVSKEKPCIRISISNAYTEKQLTKISKVIVKVIIANITP